MQAVAWVAKRALRRRATELAGVALVVALGIGTTLAALSIAWRTERAYPDYLRRADVGELVVNPSLTTDRIQQVIASTPGVLDMVSDHTFLVTVDDEAPRARREVNGSTVQIRSFQGKAGRLGEPRRVVEEGHPPDGRIPARSSTWGATPEVSHPS